MTIYRLLFVTAAFSCILASVPLRGAQRSTVAIQYVQPSKFTDFSIYGRDYQWSASYFTSQIGDYLAPAVERKVPAGKLTLTFTDIDLAGQIIAGEGAAFGFPAAKFDLLACHLHLYCKMVPAVPCRMVPPGLQIIHPKARWLDLAQGRFTMKSGC